MTFQQAARSTGDRHCKRNLKRPPVSKFTYLFHEYNQSGRSAANKAKLALIVSEGSEAGSQLSESQTWL